MVLKAVCRPGEACGLRGENIITLTHHANIPEACPDYATNLPGATSDIKHCAIT